ncbi:MAG: glycosyl hydrolase family 32 [Vicinamibacterales bacterium]
MLFSPTGVTRRAFLHAATAGLVWPRTSEALSPPPRETLYNGIVLPSPWPPRRAELSTIPQRPPYLSSPPEVISIDVGRQLFVDDFLIQESSLHRTFHRATYHAKNPLLTPVSDFERRDPYASVTGVAPSPSAMVFSDGVFFDPADRLFKLWYMAGYQQHTALAVSHDGITWDRPKLDVVRGTNIVSAAQRDSNTVWLDLDARDPSQRYKMASYDLGPKALRLRVSRDGVHWRELGLSGRCGDRSTFFRNPFRGVWCFSLRANEPGTLIRSRQYHEAGAFAPAVWADAEPVAWVASDTLDPPRPDLQTAPQIYNVDAVAYESLLLGLFTMYRGERPDREKPNDLCVAFSRDGFHWSRDWREPFVSVSETPGDWNWCNVQSAGGGCLVVGDHLYFYVSGRQGRPGTNLPGECTTGLATLRRDGFASVSDQWSGGLPRLISSRPSSLTTRPVRFSGRHLFVNADVQGELRVEVLDRAGRVLEPYSADRAIPVNGNATRHKVQWQDRPTLADLSGDIVRFRFTLSRARLYAFWVSPTLAGHSRGYLAAGGPGFQSSDDVP